MLYRTSIAVALTSALVVLLSGCHRQSKLEQEIIAKALQNKVVHVDKIDRGQLDAVITQHHGDVVLVVYWATTSGISMQHFPHAVALAGVYGNAGLQVIAVSMDNPNDLQRVVDYLEASGATSDPHVKNYVSMYGGTEVAYQDFEIPENVVPVFQLFNRAGRMAHTYADSSTNIDRDIETLLGSDPELDRLLEEAKNQPQQEPRGPLFEQRPFFNDPNQNNVDDEQPTYP